MSDEIKLEELAKYREAVESEGEIRSDAFIEDLPEMICGVAVMPLTFDQLNRLRTVRSPFVCGSQSLPSPGDVAFFLWCVSPDYRAAMRLREWGEVLSMGFGAWLFNRRRAWFIRGMKRLRLHDDLNRITAIESIRSYIRQAFQDSPGSDPRTGFSPTYYSGSASIVMELSKGRGWSQREILHMPIKCIWQYLRLLQKEADPNAIFFNPSDKIRREELEQYGGRRSQN